MKIAYFPNQVALNGQLTLRCFLNSAKAQGFAPVENSMDADAAVAVMVQSIFMMQNQK